MRKGLAGAVGLVLLLVVISVANAEFGYDVVDLGAGYSALALNDHNQAAGLYGGRAYFWDGAWHSTTSEGMSWLYEMNDSGQMVGITSNPWVKAILIERSGGSWASTLITPNSNGNAMGINNNGEVVGWEGTYLGNDEWDQAAFHWDRTDGLTYLPDGTMASASDINNDGNIVGWQTGGPIAAYYWERQGDGSYVRNTMSGAYFAYDINDAGGTSGWHDESHGPGYYWPSPTGSPTQLTGGWSEGLNNAGQIVGYSGTGQALIWKGTSWVDLDTLVDPLAGWDLREAYDINNNGWICGVGTYNGRTHGFALQPRSSGAVPELPPFALAVLGMPLALLGRKLRRK